MKLKSFLTEEQKWLVFGGGNVNSPEGYNYHPTGLEILFVLLQIIVICGLVPYLLFNGISK